MKSVWQDTEKLKHYDELKEDINTDVLVIGGGIAGLLCAWELEQRGIDTVVVEADKIAHGVTAYTTAKVTSQHGFIYNKIESEFDLQTAKLYYQANELALKKYKQMNNIDLEEKDNYVYSITDSQTVFREMATLSHINANAEIAKPTELPIQAVSAVRFNNQAQINPLSLIKEITKKLTIYENTKVIEINGTTAYTETNKIHANKIIVATHFPFINKHGNYFLKLYQERSYVIAVKNADRLPAMYIDGSQKGLSFRTYKDLLLIGGGTHRTGKKGGGWDFLRQFTQAYYPKAVEQYHWATQDCMTLDGIPYIGQYSPSLENIYVATGFNKWGMTTSMVAASLLADLITDKRNPYEKVFTPQRTILRPQLLINAAETTVNLLTPTTPRCPHLGCALKYNKQEHTWDCPCHGSRFTEKGELIEGPATDDLKRL